MHGNESRGHFRSALAGALIGGLLTAALPALGAVAGDPLLLGRTNTINSRTTLSGSPATSLRVVNQAAGATALDLQVQPGSAPLAVNTSRRISRLNADYLDGRHAADLLRAAAARTANAPNVNGDVLTVEVVAPAAGLLIMEGSVDVLGVTRDVLNCALRLDGAQVAGTGRSIVVHDTTASGGTDNGSENCASGGGIAVTAGAHTVAFEVGALDAGTTGLGEASLWALFVPFDGNGAAPAG
ncbi:MAG: hypothetical protein FJW79_10270 [Actinobacteria bacterium]|nr:hypothetical protein [Actinomycetota bacterium]